MHHVRPDLMAFTALRVVWARERERESIDELDMWEVVQNLPSGGARLRRPPGGYRVTVCNGVVTQRDGVLTGANPGRVLDGGAQRPA